MDRLDILDRARQEAREAIESNSALHEETLNRLAETHSEDEIVTELAARFCEEAAYSLRNPLD